MSPSDPPAGEWPHMMDAPPVTTPSLHDSEQHYKFTPPADVEPQTDAPVVEMADMPPLDWMRIYRENAALIGSNTRIALERDAAQEQGAAARAALVQEQTERAAADAELAVKRADLDKIACHLITAQDDVTRWRGLFEDADRKRAEAVLVREQGEAERNAMRLALSCMSAAITAADTMRRAQREARTVSHYAAHRRARELAPAADYAIARAMREIAG